MTNYNQYRPPQRKKTLEANAKQNRRLMSKVQPTILRRRSCGLCEAVNPLIKQSAEIIYTLCSKRIKNKFQEENHHFIFSVPYGEIPSTRRRSYRKGKRTGRKLQVGQSTDRQRANEKQLSLYAIFRKDLHEVHKRQN